MPDQKQATYGFLGTGEITAAIVTGLCSGLADPPRIVLSPRGRAASRALAARFPTVDVAAGNQEVLDRAPTVVLAVRPPVTREVLSGLSFRPDHVLVSAVAGVQLDRLREWAAPAGGLVRAIPLPQAASARSRTVVFPDHPAARALFDRVGGVLVPGEEKAFDAFSAVTATFAAHLDYLATIAGWLAAQGVDRRTATGYTTHIFGRLGESLSQHSDSLDTLIRSHATPGGNNEQFRADLRRDGVPAAVRRALDHILDRLRG
ncbi:NAD(P)-binding domain-containing protein [Amycolatopsis viridis]|uniref:Pyrroline-5-carboxylate reductase n=1 Tax=Amycolatopsis viridis TaxID=185678 RepID=A0ABX0SWH3_9PSEU|nr:NAD(P)-binding domain-containing protein [Amycolatopsis viridis]NIH81317.1 pyrroline-5-carboxylate reductase [Amycolatopsis viridis]